MTRIACSIMAGALAILFAARAPASDFVDALKGIADGKSPASVSISYTEERPRELLLQVALRGGYAEALLEHAKPDCPQTWEKRCWENSSKRVGIANSEYRRIISLVASGKFISAPHSEAPAPSGNNMSLGVAVEGGGKFFATFGMDALQRYPELKSIRASILDIAGVSVK